MEKFTKEEVEQAYIKLKSYIYYDSSDILLRQQLVEFETNLSKDSEENFNTEDSIYNEGINSENRKKRHPDLKEKISKIAKELRNYHLNPKFFDSFIERIEIDFYPKKYTKSIEEENYISNKRVKSFYKIERVTPFIKAPIELHLIAVLWILRKGVALDRELKDECIGNRLLLNKDKSAVVQGSGLFKPYFSQYQKWRDDAVKVAELNLKNRKDIAFLNLDIKDYFSSIRLSKSELFGNTDFTLDPENLEEIFFKIHKRYSNLLINKYQVPHSSLDDFNDNNIVDQVVLPIGLISSYVLANYFFKKFDERILNHIKPAYYGRYVDDLLFVIVDPKPGFKEYESNKKMNLDFSLYKKLNPTKLEKFVLEIFFPILDLGPYPREFGNIKEGKKLNFFRIEDYPNLFIQGEKSLLYLFDKDEYHLVIDKLKQELDERTSEFRDWPSEEENGMTFTESAYHLEYDGTEGKIRTLKDYKENRYGLTVFLANKIFSALRHEGNFSDEECQQLVNFFKGENCLEFYRLWERILTLLLVNKNPKFYIDFYLHCVDQISKINLDNSFNGLEKNVIQKTLLFYLDAAHEISNSLNLKFLSSSESDLKNFEIRLKEFEFDFQHPFWDDFRVTHPNSLWLLRYRKANMVRHHYVIHPLLTYTKGSKDGSIIDLTDLNINFKHCQLDNFLIENSPRRVKFWECCMSEVFQLIGNEFGKRDIRKKGDYQTGLFKIERDDDKDPSFYLDDAFELFKKLNHPHIPSSDLNSESYKNRFFKRDNQQKSNSPLIELQEIQVNSTKKPEGKFKISFANTPVNEKETLSSMRGESIFSIEKYNKLSNFVKTARRDKSDVLLLPEFFVPINLLSSLVRYSEKNEVLIVTGLEHLKIDDIIFNFIVTVLPFEINGVTDAVVVFRVKNHYAPAEDSTIRGNHYTPAIPEIFRYDLFIWKNLYFAPYYCFELANVWHRSLFKSKIDLLIAVEWNKDTNYFSNIVEASSRDLHCYVAQVNTSQFGDSRLTQPVESARLDLLKVKGGLNDTIIIGELDLSRLREFQRKTYDVTSSTREFKPLPPDFEVQFVLRRIKNSSVFG